MTAEPTAWITLILDKPIPTSSASKEIHRTLQNPKFLQHFRSMLLFEPVMSPMNPDHALPAYLFNICLRVLTFIPIYANLSLPFRFIHQNPACRPLLAKSCNTLPSLSPSSRWFNFLSSADHEGSHHATSFVLSHRRRPSYLIRLHLTSSPAPSDS
jgi:hypothetical protein